MKKEPLFSVKLRSTVLPRAQLFSSLEPELKNAFASYGISIEPSSPIFRSHGKNTWRVVSESDADISAYRLQLSFDQATKAELIDVYPDSISGLHSSVWDFKAFTSSIRSPESNQRIYYTGSVRESLNRKQKQKWDYFFRPDVPKISKSYDNIIRECQKDLEDSRASLSKSKVWAGCFLAWLPLLYFGPDFLDWGDVAWSWFGFIIFCIVLFVGITRGKVSLNFPKLGKEVSKLETYLRKVEGEKANTIAQLDEVKLPDDDKMLGWLATEVGHMEEESRAKYIFSDTIKKVDTLKGLGIYQPEFSDIARKFPKKIHTFFGFRITPQRLLYSGLYIVFVFQTDEKICITKFFYDFILSKKYGQKNLEYHYSDLVGIAINTKLINNPFENEDVENQEVNTIWMSFTDSNSIEIAIIDQDTSDSIADRLTDSNTLPDDDNSDWLDLDDERLESLPDLPSEDGVDLSMGIALKIIKNIKDQKIKLSR